VEGLGHRVDEKLKVVEESALVLVVNQDSDVEIIVIQTVFEGINHKIGDNSLMNAFLHL
jgi:hypothetical protein